MNPINIKKYLTNPLPVWYNIIQERRVIMNIRTKRRKRNWLIKKLFSQSLVVSMLVIMILLTNNMILKGEKAMVDNAPVVANNATVEVEPEIILPPKYNVGLSDYLQEYTFSLTEKCPDVDYELALAVLYTESKFNSQAKNVNRNGSIDRGIAQINSNYTEHYAEVSGFNESFDPYVAEHGIKACVYKLQTLADVWKAKGVTDKETLELYMIQSYNRGVVGFKNYMASNGAESNYSRLILQRKNELLSEGEIITK